MHVEVQGERIPALGLGTWELFGSRGRRAIRHALELGYRHLDTAQLYDNEEQVGRALVDSGLDRGEVFLTTKIAPRNLDPRQVRPSTEESLRHLGVEYVDLLLIHWPSRDVPLEQTLGAMVALRDDGLARHLGVSNFTPAMLREALRIAPLLTNQVEFHPYLHQDELHALALEHDLMLTAYSPLAKGRVQRDPTLAEIGERHGKTPAQVALRWLVQQPDVSAIPRSSDPGRQAENLDVFDFALEDEEMERVASLGRGRRLVDPGWAPDW